MELVNNLFKERLNNKKSIKERYVSNDCRSCKFIYFIDVINIVLYELEYYPNENIVHIYHNIDYNVRHKRKFIANNYLTIYYITKSKFS